MHTQVSRPPKHTTNAYLKSLLSLTCALTMIGRAQVWKPHAVSIVFLLHPRFLDMWIDACSSCHDFLHMTVL